MDTDRVIRLECDKRFSAIEAKVDRNSKLIIAIILITQGLNYANHLGLW